jgi:hypothetical protein
MRVYILLSFIGLAGVPVLLFIAWRAWIKNVREGMPAWRNGLCIVALLLLSINWVGAALLEVPYFLVQAPYAQPP